MNSLEKNLLLHVEKEWDDKLIRVINYFNTGSELEAEILYSTYLANSLN
jgi:hypothetical protein